MEIQSLEFAEMFNRINNSFDITDQTLLLNLFHTIYYTPLSYDR